MSHRENLTDCPALMAQWDFSKNDLDPAQLTAGSGECAWWICDKGHSWKAMIKNRGKGTGCPYCSNKKVLAGFNDLLTRNPSLAKEWDSENNTLTPSQVTCSSRVMAYWQCSEGHLWKAAVCDRSKGGGCPICHNKKVLPGYNDLLTLNPDLANEWAYEINTLLPTQVTPGSEKKVWWRCEKGHYWQALISNRNAGRGCPYCIGFSALAGFNDLQTLMPDLAREWNLDKNKLLPTQVTMMSNRIVWWNCEKGHLWKAHVYSRARGTGCPYCENLVALAGFNDLQTLKPELAQEWDGKKNKFGPSQVMPGSGKLAWWKCGKGHSWKASVCSRAKGNGCPYCSNQRVLAGFNDLQTLNPKLSREWDFEKNTIVPSQVTPGSEKKVWWKCAKGHSWKTQINVRNRGGGCPYCTGRLLLPGFNDLQTRRPDLLEEWDYEKNVLPPTQFAVGTVKEVWWKCRKGHSWKAPVNRRGSKRKDRSGIRGCPYCASKKVLPGFNDLNTLNPKLSDEWDYEKNTLTPSQVTVASGKSVWWRCRKGHSWEAQIASRSVSGNNCPYCSGQKVLKDFNDLGTVNPKLADEWDAVKNVLTPSQVTAGSGKSVWWKCSKGHSWRAVVADRHSNGSRCPYCLGVFPYTPRCVK